jgi:hypothetical protein
LRDWIRSGLCLAALVTAPSLLEASLPLYRNGSDLSLDLSIRIQLQYYDLDGEGWSEQKIFFRRLRPTLEARLSPSFQAEAEFDFGETIEGEAVEFKDLFLSYTGFSSKRLVLTFGNEKAVFSRQFQSSSKSLTLVDRGLVGIDDFGTLDRVLGARADYRDRSEKFELAAGIGLASHERDDSQMEFDSPLNASEESDMGLALTGRVELEPRGEVAFDQGDFGSPQLRFALSAAFYRWANTSEPAAASAEQAVLDSARGIEMSGALRGRGLSADVEVQWVQGRTVDPNHQGGIYDGGEADLRKLSVQSGYLVWLQRLEVVGGFDRLTAATYASPWKRVSIGGTYYWKQNSLKLQVNYIRHFAFFGVSGDDPHALVTQLQLLF